ncbi:cfem domain containing protein [Niveomyces insectorum RCEF 264]|uniref:Cfem domain containing protein n=1 Tax=Niveomyces insectorum RCEF 264 TaxID=1081102 RepID=A0A167UV33_9HYPO|nr:cfem domain containing protein [Niveomyces insectorum RCEF 264]
MRSHNSLVFLFAGFTGLVRSQTFPNEASMPGCGETCLDNLISQASTFGCEQNAIGCLCAAPAFSSGVHDCATGACAPDLLPSVTDYLAGVCASTCGRRCPPCPLLCYARGTVSAAHLVFSTCTSRDLERTDLEPPRFKYCDSEPEFELGGEHTLGATHLERANDGKQCTRRAEQHSGGGGSLKHPTLVASPSSTTSSAPAAAAPLSAGAKAGIGIGVSVGAVAVIGAVVVFIIARKHRERRIPRSSIKISDPLPGSGPFYGDSSRSERYNNVAELEMKSRRYEDMVPRQVPRNMV